LNLKEFKQGLNWAGDLAADAFVQLTKISGNRLLSIYHAVNSVSGLALDFVYDLTLDFGLDIILTLTRCTHVYIVSCLCSSVQLPAPDREQSKKTDGLESCCSA
jgi:hypothetical protein